MTATLTIEFENGDKEEMVLSKMIERSSKDEGKSIDFMENKNGKWIMTYSPSLCVDKQLKSIQCVKAHDLDDPVLRARLTLGFTDDSKEEIILDHAIALNLREATLKSLTFRQLTDGLWIMNFTSNLWKGRKFKNVHCSKENR